MRTEPAWTSYPFQTALSWIATFIIAAIVVLAANCTGTPAHAGPWYADVGAGAALYTPTVSDGTWYQQAFPHDFDTKAFTWRVGAGFTFNERWSIQAHYLNLGAVKVNAWFVDDPQYDSHTHQCTHDCHVTNHLQASDAMQGVDLSVTRTWQLGPVEPFLKAGLAMMFHRFTLVVNGLPAHTQHRYGRIPMGLIGGGFCYKAVCAETTYYQGSVGMDSGCIGGPCDFPISKQFLLSLISFRIPIGG